MKFTSIVAFFFLVFTVPHSVLGAERGDSTSSPFAKIPLRQSEPKNKLAPTEMMKQFMIDVEKVNPVSIQQAGYLLLTKFPEFAESDFQAFLSTKGVLGYLLNPDMQTPKLSSSDKKILIALSHFYGWGQPRDPIIAFELIESVKDLQDSPPGLARYLMWEFFKETGHLAGVRNTTKICRLDSQVLVDLLKSSQTGFSLARRDHLEVAEHSGLVFNKAHPLLTVIQFASVIPTLSSPTSKAREKEQKDWRHVTERLTRRTAHNFYFPTAMATLLSNAGQLPAIHEVVIEKESLQLSLIGFSSPLLLQDVLSHVVALTRIHQLEASKQGERYFVNLTTLRNDPYLTQFHIPLETPLPLETAVKTLPYQITTLKGTFRQLCDDTIKIDKFFKRYFGDTSYLLEKVHGIARLERLFSKLRETDNADQVQIVDILLKTESLFQALLEAEWYALKDRTVLPPEQRFMLLLSVGLAQERTRTALSFAHRPDHKGNHVEEWYYEKLLNHLFSLLDEKTSLTSTELANLCMKPLHVFLAYLHGDGTSPVWVNPKTYIQKTYEIIKLSPDLLVSWLEKNTTSQLHDSLREFEQTKPAPQDADLTKRLRAFVATADQLEVRAEFIPLLLMRLNILADTPEYE